MFDPSATPRVFALPPGVDFPAQVARGLAQRMAGADPTDWARLRIFVNTSRMGRRVQDALSKEAPRLLPRIHTLTDLGGDGALEMGLYDLPPMRPALRRRLELAQLVDQLLQMTPDLAPRAAAFDLADSLAQVLDEMHDESVPPDALRALDLSQHSEHWARALRFLNIVLPYAEGDRTVLDPGARLQLAVDQIVQRWQTAPPTDPILMVGSTGSRGTTARLMDAVAGLPQGAVILPGFDFDQPQAIWDRMAAADADQIDPMQDHPQDRLGQVMARLGLTARDIVPWQATPETARTALWSLALRPAPVTDQWRSEGPALGDPAPACAGMTLLEADSPRSEAAAIALCLREAVEAGKTVALISPDRMLTRQVTAALDRWRIVPDDSAGRPLALSAPGRLLRQTAQLLGSEVSAETLVALLKHPLTATGAGARNRHLIYTRSHLEMWLRRSGPVYPTPDQIIDWAEDTLAKDAKRDRPQFDDPQTLRDWAAWVADLLASAKAVPPGPLADLVEAHVALTIRVANGTKTGHDPGELWLEKPGEAALALIESLRAEADAGGSYTPRAYGVLLTALLQGETVRDAVRVHDTVMILGPREAREQGADVVVLGGLNDGTWPTQPPPDPWLNRQMRRDAGLTLPDRRIGLQAHDFQQAACADHVILTRARRDAEAETVPSRWLNRLTNLLGGLGAPGEAALAGMRARGDAVLARLADLETPPKLLPQAKRPAPRPPAALRPRSLSFTDVEKLRRDPYHIYARYVLKLRPLDDLRQAPDARLRGQMLHKVFEVFTQATWDGLPDTARDVLLKAADQVLASGVGWTAAERQWRTHIARIADGFLRAEADRRTLARPLRQESWGSLDLPGGGVLRGRADRFDLTPDGQLVIYDYKSGSPPSNKVITHYNRQLHLEAAVAEAGGFDGVPAAPVARIAYLGLHTALNVTEVTRDDHPDFVAEAWDAFLTLRDAYLDPARGYLSRRAVSELTWAGDFDHLARHGEWDDTDTATPEDVG